MTAKPDDLVHREEIAFIFEFVNKAQFLFELVFGVTGGSDHGTVLARRRRSIPEAIGWMLCRQAYVPRDTGTGFR